MELTDASLDEFFELSGILPLVEAIIMFSSILIVEHRFEYVKLIEIVEIYIYLLSLLQVLLCKIVV